MAIVDTDTGEILEVRDRATERKAENKDFVMLYRKFINQLAELGMQDSQALRVLLFITRHMDNRNALAVPMTLIAEMLDVSRQTVSAKIKYLAENGWIAVYKLGRQNVYIVNPDVVWTSYAEEKAYCKFESMVMLSSSDNWAVSPKDDRMHVRHVDRDVLSRLAMQEFGEAND